MSGDRGELYRIDVAPGACDSGFVRQTFFAPLLGLREMAAGEIVATATDADGHTLPAVTRLNGALTACFDAPSTIEAILAEEYAGAKLARPGAARLPFDYTALPMWLVGLAARALSRPIDLSSVAPFPRYP